ncbi:fungal-specific transcription factor domain-containing protein [Dendryphion nanum]|uniref:Fungal-specific transcription factor domain-containing protein n=1 Tax=Dendryphion nanum TaxID=256645 RepID=A0A9P9DV17_9PLEO|nr:fungal-specific transcription factor domain-containing protein [Dendryphion nanum]
MTKRKDMPETTNLRKRALVSCDRCKTRRARCIRENPDEACTDCKNNGVVCESKLPRKQRVYGSVETLSLRYRALEALVKGLFPEENIQDTSTLYRIASTKNIKMPAPDDYKPADIFNQPSQHPYTSPQTNSPGSLTPGHNPFVETCPQNPVEKLLPTQNGVHLYFGPSSSFRLALTMRDLVTRCNSIPQAKPLLWHPNSSLFELANSNSIGKMDRRTMTPTQHSPLFPSRRKRPRTEEEIPVTEGNYASNAPRNTPGTIADFLPSRSVADALVAAFFDQVHPHMPIFQKSMFEFRYEGTWRRRDTSIQENEETAWLCCLALVFAFGAQALSKFDLEESQVLQEKYLDFVDSYFRYIVSTTSLANIQALMLLQLYDHNVGKRNSAWLLVGTAARMAISMGMHREATYPGFDLLERNSRRIVWWMVYILERLLCQYLGRPSIIEDAEISTCPPDDGLSDSNEMPLGMFTKALEGARILYAGRRRIFFVENSAEERTTPPVYLASQLLMELDQWHGTWPEHLQLGATILAKQTRQLLLLHIYYNYNRCQITTRFLIERIECNFSRLEGKEAYFPEDKLALSEECINSATKSLEYLNILADLKALNGVTWLDAFYVFHAILLVCSLYLSRPPGEPETNEDKRRKSLVRAILRSTRVTQLAPSYHILSQIAFQFASITGATDDPYPVNQGAAEPNIVPPIPQQPVLDGIDHSMIGNPETWPDTDPANFLLDWFGISDDSPAGSSITYADGFGDADGTGPLLYPFPYN